MVRNSSSHSNRRAVSPKLIPSVSSAPYLSLLLYASLKLVYLDTLNGTVLLTTLTLTAPLRKFSRKDPIERALLLPLVSPTLPAKNNQFVLMNSHIIFWKKKCLSKSTIVSGRETHNLTKHFSINLDGTQTLETKKIYSYRNRTLVILLKTPAGNCSMLLLDTSLKRE